MTTILTVYESDYGNTKKMAESISEGAQSIEGVQSLVKTSEEVKKEDLINCDGFILGSPVHMGSPHWKIKKFIDEICGHLWIKDLLVGKVGGVFATGSGFGSSGGGAEVTLIALLNNLVELGMVIVPLPKNTPGYHLSGLQWGPCARSGGEKMEQIGISKEKLEVAFHHGRQIASVAKHLKGFSFKADLNQTLSL